MTVLLLNYRELNFTNIGNFLATGKKWCIVAAFACMLLSFVFEALSLWYIARRLGHKSKLRSSFAYASADVYYSAITPSATGGQPAAAFYMVRDGMNAGTAAMTLVIHVASYATAIFMLVMFAFIVRPGIFLATGSVLAKVLIVIGAAIQVLLIGFMILCIVKSNAVLKVGNGCISLLHKMKIVKKPDKWRNKLADEVEKYHASREIIKTKPSLFIVAILLNLAYRTCHTLMTCFVCYAVAPDPGMYVGSVEPSFLDLFAMQLFVLIGHNSIPLPGGVGAFEFMYLNVYGEFFVESFIMSAMMISRFISYYLRMIVAAIVTLIYHSVGIGKSARSKPDAALSEQAPQSGQPADEKDNTTGSEGAANADLDPETASEPDADMIERTHD